jgi:hypothetical protein
LENRESSRQFKARISKLNSCWLAALQPHALAPLAPDVHGTSRPRRRPAKAAAVCRRSWGAPRRRGCRGGCCCILLVIVTLTAAVIILNLALLTHSRVAAGAAGGPSIAAGRARDGAAAAAALGARRAATLRQTPLAAALAGSGHLVSDDAIWRQVSIQDDLHHPLHIRHPPIHCKQIGSRHTDGRAGM